jgi:glycerophosphoryl diester phosphodiesterase
MKIYSAISLGLFCFTINAYSQLHGPVDPGCTTVHELIDVWDAEKVRARSPLLIAHRGGVVMTGAPECSRMAVKLAAKHCYDMVELDLRESKDHHPVVFHDENMLHSCGIEGQTSDFTLEALSKIQFLNSEENVTSLDSMLALCSSLKLGVMFDVKSGNRSELFFKRILELVEKYKLDKACMLLGDTRAREYLKEKVLLTLPDDLLEKVNQGEAVDLQGYYWFGVPKTWPLDLVKPVQENGALVIPAINAFRFSEENHRAEALKDVERLLKVGVDGFQLDCIYQDFLGRSRVGEQNQR